MHEQGSQLDPRARGQIDLFRGLSAAELCRVTRLLHRQSFRAGGIFFTVEQPGEVAYIILTGTLKVQVEREESTNVILAILAMSVALAR